MIAQEFRDHPDARPTRVLRAIGVATSTWYDTPTPTGERRRPGPPPKVIPEIIEKAVVEMATSNPWYGYKRIAVMCRRAGIPVTNRQCFLGVSRWPHPFAADPLVTDTDEPAPSASGFWPPRGPRPADVSSQPDQPPRTPGGGLAV